MQVLFVEDDAMNRRVVRDMLKVVGTDMEEAPEAETGLRLLAERKYDIILMDLRMPGMDGLTAIRLLREGTTTRTAPRGSPVAGEARCTPCCPIPRPTA